MNNQMVQFLSALRDLIEENGKSGNNRGKGSGKSKVIDVEYEEIKGEIKKKDE